MDGPWGDTWCSYGGLSPSHLETSHCKPPCGTFSSTGFTKHGGTQMQITQRCPSGDKTEVLVLVLVVIHTMLLVHPHFTLCLLEAALLMLPVPRLVSIVPAATLRAWHPPPQKDP